MPILKADTNRPATKEAIVLDLGDLGAQARKLREAAEARARSIIERAEAEAQRIIDGAEAIGKEQGLAAGREQGAIEGREAGRQEALENFTKELEQLQTSWLGLVEQWDAQRQTMRREARRSVVELAVKMAEQVVRRTIAVDDRVIARQLDDVLELVMRPADAEVRIHPDDRATVDAALPQIVGRLPQLKHVSIREDEAIKRGGCELNYGRGAIDARVETQLRRIVELILPDGCEPDSPASSSSATEPESGEADEPSDNETGDA